VKIITCIEMDCKATARDTSKERGRFRRRHPSLCKEFRRHSAERLVKIREFNEAQSATAE
jgi:hypothetical protein